MRNESLLLRADANETIGSGHVMRCFALAQAFHEGGRKAVLVTAGSAGALEERGRDEGIEVSTIVAQPGSVDDAEQLAALAHGVGAKWVVLDGYCFGSAYQESVKRRGISLLLMDDFGHADHYFADIVVNHNLHADRSLYKKREPYTRLLLGTKYVLLRKEFLSYRGRERKMSERDGNVLVTLGGADRENVSLKVILALKGVEVDRLKVVVALGESNSHYEELHSAIENVDFSIELKRSAKNMARLMAWADVAISAAGTTSWELAFMGLPSLVIALADNQSPVAESLDAAGVARNLGWWEDFKIDEVSQMLFELLEDPKKREDMARTGRRLIDGRGVDRVTRLLQKNGIDLRPIREDDCELLWGWANDPDVRAASFSSEIITWEQHVRWFKSRMGDQHCLIYLAMTSEGMPIGQARFDRMGDEIQISVSVTKEFRDRGYGSRIIELASQRAFDVADINQIDSYIRIENEASKRAFMNAGYEEMGLTTIKGHPALHLRLTE